MKRAVLVLGIIAGLGLGSAQGKEAPAGFSPFWKKFQAAVLQGDREAVAAMTYLPFYWGKTLDKAGFLKSYPKLFDDKARECFRGGKLSPDGSFQVLFCGRLMYRFGSDQGRWLLLEIADND
ncbi:MAG: hypothetical protein U1F66_01540 [bacterium]